MNAYIFIGPTISASEAEREVDAHFLPPVKQGDFYRVALKSPRVIGIIDGHFEQVPAVWHKEILWAMSRGIYVFGASSMGALRAAELWQFGMEGVGRIFEAYRDGVLVDDDEVALRHGPPETGYVALSEPMVNVRATLQAAKDGGIASESTCEGLVRIAKKFFYPERSYPAILQRGRELGVSDTELAALDRWLPNSRIDQKRDDAIAMLQRIRTLLAAEPSPKLITYNFQHTDMWETVVRLEAQCAVE